MTCVYAVSCPVGQFGNTATKSCSSTCPNKEYPSINTRLCTACPATCAECTSDTVCTSCISTAVFSNITAKCYAYCDATLHLSYNGQCYSSCPDGTYLDFTNVYCQLCNSICKTCFNGATNCTSCDGSYLYNNSCLSNCPTNHYNLNNTCQFCNDSVPSCSKPLTFETVTKT
jgi:proprotein convertase subtilisin/kexin type 5